jgi:hypothetical protein
MSFTLVGLIGIAIGIGIEIKKNYHTNMFDPDSDSDIEKRFEKHQTSENMNLLLREPTPFVDKSDMENLFAYGTFD